MFDIFLRFFVLGLMSFGGPIAHIGYFQKEFVEKRKWLTEEDFAQALALCQFLPGPASSQLGMYIGYKKGSYLGSITAFIAFTFPSFFLLTNAAIFSYVFKENQYVEVFISAAKLLAVIVVFDAIYTMGKKFISDKITLFFCLFSCGFILFNQGLLSQLVAIVLAGLFGWINSSKKNDNHNAIYLSHSHSIIFLTLFVTLFIFSLYFNNGITALFSYFYQAGSLVFGGGHVVLPLLQPLLSEHLSRDVLVEGYAAAQLVPGPMFTIASYLGAMFDQQHPIIGSIIATTAIFLPGALLLFAILPVWVQIKENQRFTSMICYINATVVGLLIAAFINPIIFSAIFHFTDVIAVSLGYLIMKKWDVSVFIILLMLIMMSAIQSVFI